MLSQNSVTNARWEVIWQGKRGLVRKPFDGDFGGALRLYTLVKSSGRKLTTLRCCNVGFPPPVTITQHEVVSWVVVKRGGKRYKKKVIEHEDRMIELNNRGIMWCSYCIQLRRYQTATINRRVVIVCPVCKVTSLNFYIRQHNPKATVLEQRRTTRVRRRRPVRRRARKP